MSTETQTGENGAVAAGSADADGHRQPHRQDVRAPDQGRDHPRPGPAADQDRRRGLRPDDLRPGVHEHRVVPLGDHLHRRRQGHPRVPRLPDRAARRAVDLPRGRLPARPRRAADAAAARRVDARDHDPHVRARERQGASCRASATTRTRWGCCSARSARSRRSIPTRSRSRTRRAAYIQIDPPDREDADARRVRLPPQPRAAVRLSGQRPVATPATSSRCCSR